MSTKRSLDQPLTPIHRKVPWKLSPTRKANQRARLKNVDAVIEAVRASGVSCSALVRSSPYIKHPFLRLPPIRTAHSSYQKSMKCHQRTSTPFSHPMRKAIAKVFTKFQNGQECVLCISHTNFSFKSYHGQLTLRVNPKGF